MNTQEPTSIADQEGIEVSSTDPGSMTPAQQAVADAPASKLFTALPQSTLPSDANSLEFATAIQALHSQFESRSEFNFMVADQMALRGVPPNGKNVLSVGRWGNSAAVQSDVRAWYTALANRLSSEQASIPDAAKRAANNLFEQLWVTAQSNAAEPLRKAVADLQECQAILSTTRTAMATAESTHVGEIQSLTAQLVAERDKRTQANDELLSAREMLDASNMQVVALNASISQAAMEHARERNAWALEQSSLTGALALANSQMTGLQEQKAELLQFKQKAAARLEAVEEALSNERTRSDSAARSHALAVDQFREDVKEANKRADAAHQAIEDVKTQLSQTKDLLARASIETAKLMQELATARDENLQFPKDPTSSIQL